MRQCTIDKLDKIKQVLEQYREKDLLPITLRQLYYELVSQNYIENKEQEYRSLSVLLVKARNQGVVDFSNIIDSTRHVDIVSQYSSIDELLEENIQIYRKNRWETQDCYIEVWVEKSAMASTIQDITAKYCVPFLADRGYNSATMMHDAGMRFFDNAGKDCVLIYLGDHDPSGLGMDKDLEKRINMYAYPKVRIKFERIALTIDQINEYNLPPNPAKKTDPRFKSYSEQYGEKSWELEALPVEVVRELLEEKIRSYIDFEKYDKVLEEEESDKEKLRQMFS